MGSVRCRKDTGHLFFDFRLGGVRCREQTMLSDTAVNRKKMKTVLERIEADIALGVFDYRRFFPESVFATQFDVPTKAGIATASVVSATPLFRDFAETWYRENEVSWRRSYRKTVRTTLARHLLPRFGGTPIGTITKADVLGFRADLARERGRTKGESLSNRRINAVLTPLRQVLNEAADRLGFATPFVNIKPLKVKRSDVNPFTMDEVSRIVATVRADFRSYYTVRFFTGMRTGEIDGLKWKYVDFERRCILVRETIVNGEEDETKTDSSQRDIAISRPVYEALRAQETTTRGISAFVFCNRDGGPLDHTNVTKRVWYPLLRYLGLTARRPYQTRHTAATLWLAAGESPEWIARQLGHTTTEMLFRVYSRFVPNLTRKDGSAFERLLSSTFPPSDPDGGLHA
jgi:integrase